MKYGFDCLTKLIVPFVHDRSLKTWRIHYSVLFAPCFYLAIFKLYFSYDWVKAVVISVVLQQ